MSGGGTRVEDLTVMDPGPLRTVAGHLSGAAGSMRLIARLLPAGLGDWVGRAGEAAMEKIEHERSTLVRGASVLQDCSSALSRHADVVEEVRGRARQVALLLAELDAAVPDPASAQAADHERRRAAGQVRGLEEDVRVSAGRARLVVARATQDAPAGPSGAERLVGSVGSVLVGAAMGAEDAVGSAVALSRINPADVAADAASDPVRAWEQVRAEVGGVAEHPVVTAKVLSGWDVLEHDPAMWAGQLAPGIAVGVATDGASVGVAAGLGARALGAGARAERLVAQGVDVGVSVGQARGEIGAEARRLPAPPHPPGYRTPGNPMAAPPPAQEGSRRLEQIRGSARTRATGSTTAAAPGAPAPGRRAPSTPAAGTRAPAAPPAGRPPGPAPAPTPGPAPAAWVARTPVTLPQQVPAAGPTAGPPAADGSPGPAWHASSGRATGGPSSPATAPPRSGGAAVPAPVAAPPRCVGVSAP